MHLTLESATHGTFNLDDVLMTGKGVQALSGATGLGLPPVSAQWLESAGDGSVFRGKRVLSRDIDLPLHFKADDRDELIEMVGKLARMLDGACTLRVVNDDGTSWWTEVHRVGGGDYIYGEDTIGEDDLSLVITLRSGSPYWKSGAPVESSANLVNGAGVETTYLFIDNPGDVPAYPKFVFQGPLPNGVTVGFKSLGWWMESVDFDGPVWSGDTLTIDCATGRVYDQDGNSRYRELASAPQFFKIPAGGRDVSFDFKGDLPAPGATSTEGQAKNLVTNPNFELNAASWTAAYTYISTSTPTLTIARDTTQKKSGAASLKVQKVAGNTYLTEAGATYKFTGLDPDKVYGMTAACFAPLAAQPPTSATDYLPKLRWSHNGYRNTWFGAGPVENFNDCWGKWQTVIGPGTQPFQDGTLEVMLVVPDNYKDGIFQPIYFDNVWVWDTGIDASGAASNWWDNIETPLDLPYLDGAQTTPGYRFWWEGTAHASRSVAERDVTSAQAAVEVSLEPQRWAVI
jgi:hypothetical protein